MIKNCTVLGFGLFLLVLSPLQLNAEIIHLYPGDFEPSSSDRGNWHIFSDTGDYMYAEFDADYRDIFSRSLELPHLGTLDQVRIYYYDNSTYNLTVSFIRQKVSDFSQTVLAQYTTSGEAVFYREEDLESFLYPTIKTKGYRYYVRVNWSGADGTNLSLVGIRIRYYAPRS